VSKPKLKVSFSGGRSSAYMAAMIKQNWSDVYEIVFVFCNTSQEDDRTLVFVNEVDKYFDLGVVWLEAVINEGMGNATTHRVVNFETAKRNGEVYLEMVKKYGVPNKIFQPCNRELKLRPMDSYMRSIGWEDYATAIGIRCDESRRVSEKAEKLNILYPLVDSFPVDKQDVLSYWEAQSFDLGIDEHEGNCLWCFKKSDKKLFQLISERPEIFDFPALLDDEYGFHGAPYYGSAPDGAIPRVPFRGALSTKQLFTKAAIAGVVPGSKRRIIPIGVDDRDTGSCSESCEAYETGESEV